MKKLHMRAEWEVLSEVELEAREYVRFVAGRLGFSVRALDELSLCIIEASINAIEHGKSNWLELEIFWEDPELAIHISQEMDNPPDLPSMSDLANDKEKLTKRGWGLHIIKRFVDDFEFKKEGTRLTLIMKKRR